MFKKIFFVLIFFFTSLNSQALPLKSVILELQKKYNNIKDLKCSFVQEVFNKTLEKKELSSGKIYFIKGGKFFWLTEKPSRQKTISNGKNVWFYNVGEKQAIVTQLTGSQSQTALLFITGGGNLAKEFKVSSLSKDNFTLRLVPKKEIPSVEKIHLHIIPQEFIIDRLEIYYYFGNRCMIKISEIKINENILEKHQLSPLDPLLDKDFNFSPPTNVEIISNLIVPCIFFLGGLPQKPLDARRPTRLRPRHT